LKAEKIHPKDYIILSNIVQDCRFKGDKKNVIKYLEKVIKYGNEQAKTYEKQQINELKK